MGNKTISDAVVKERIGDFMHFVASSRLEDVEYTQAQIDDSIRRIKAGESSDVAVAEILDELRQLRDVG